MRHNISIHLTLGELAICRENYWFRVVGGESEIGIVAQVISVVIAHIWNGGPTSDDARHMHPYIRTVSCLLFGVLSFISGDSELRKSSIA